MELGVVYRKSNRPMIDPNTPLERYRRSPALVVCTATGGRVLTMLASFRAMHRESYLFDGNVEFVIGCLLVHALAVVVLVEDSKADGDAGILSAEDSDNDEDSVVVAKEDSDDDEDVTAASELEIGETVR
jgi:hypothetical protein